MSTLEGSGRFVNDGLSFYVDFANKKSFSPNMINYSVWTTGPNGISSNTSLYGSNGFSLNGSSDENIRIESVNPFGDTQSVVWVSNSLDGISGRPIVGSTSYTSSGDGGWNGSRFSINPKKLYRFSVWTKRNAMTIGPSASGSFYLGVYAYGSDGGIQEIASKISGTNSNAYFHYTPNSIPSNVSNVSPPLLGGLDVWTLVVGHVWPANTATASLVVGSNVNGLPLNYNHQDSGIWTKNSGKIGNLVVGDWIWNATSSQTILRTYLFYSDDVTATQSFIYPRVDLIDGTEPTIQQLLTGVEPVKNLMGNGYNMYSTTLNDVIYINSSNFSTERNGCIIFNPSKRDNIQGTISTTFSMYSASIWFKTTNNITTTSSGSTLFHIRDSSFNRLDLYLGSVTSAVTNEVITLATTITGSTAKRTAVTDITISGNKWNNIIINWESNIYAIYLNGEKQSTTSGTSTDVELNTIFEYITIGSRFDPVAGLGSFFDGKIESLAMWKRTLTSEEITRIYNKNNKA